MAANVYASATEDDAGGAGRARVLGGATIDCPDVGTNLTTVPEKARPAVDKELAALDEQIAQAYQRLAESAPAIQQDPGVADEKVVGPLEEERTATLDRISGAMEQEGDRPEGLGELADCSVVDSGNASGGPGDGQGDGQGEAGDQGGDEGAGQEQGGGNGGQAGNGPVAADFVDIESVQPNVAEPAESDDASKGTFVSSCGVNENGLFNSDNVIAAPGVANGAHHFHDYIGNQATNAFSSDEELAAADTSCVDQGDKSSYYWPVLRLQNGTEEQDANSPGGGIEGNVGEIVTPKEVTLTFEGNPQGEVTAMPRLLRIITGDAKSFVNGPANANASWSCTGFEDRQLADKYPLCPQGSDVVRTFDFQSCWDGRNTDSANHRTHMAFVDGQGNCPSGFTPVPQLVQRIVYDVDAPSLDDGGATTPLFAVDSFPEQLHKPGTDHGDFINVFDEDLMREMVDCINSGRTCGAGTGGGEQPGEDPQEEPTEAPGAPDEGGDDGEQPGDNGGGDQGNGGGDKGKGNAGGDKGNGNGGGDQQENPSEPPVDAPATEEPAGDDATTPPGGEQPEVRASAKDDDAAGAGQGDDGAGRATPDVGTATNDGGQRAAAADSTRPQAVSGGLADTGAQLWPAAVGAVLLVAGVVLLRRVRRA
ncbi:MULTISPECIES: DUF1996 domain-containing protein [unclassified Streptomyces]|uniref:DUF1996 domain-containing protein n=1 Tax=unclassified Streptomyces TaxID=2593676 RepID=UPI0007EDC374|nr:MULTISPECIES: DUF1996 domain-containing protein [unclassified Streptomyces]MCP3768151.1 DUF1996 domain-containing protein [Streptomyces sp. MAR25Y5]OBQ46809.1 hypothetical protein A4U61_15475 [Streptomyces sp. H-KF8]